MTWAKLDCGWADESWVDLAASVGPCSRAELLAAWAVLLAWSVGHATDGRVPRPTAERVVGASLGLGVAKVRRVLGAMTSAGALSDAEDSVEFSSWEQTNSDDIRSKREANRDRKAKSRSNDSAQLGQMSRCDTPTEEIRREKKRKEETRGEQKHAPTERVLPAPAREASPAPPIVAKADTPPTASRVGVEGLSEDTRKILAELSRHPKLAPIASPELAGVIDGRRITSGTSIADVARAIGDAVAHADEGIAAAPLRRMVVGYCDHARHRGRPKVAPAQSEVPIERAWYPNQGTIEGWAKQPVTQAELDHIDKVFGPGPWDSDKAAVKAGAA